MSLPTAIYYVESVLRSRPYASRGHVVQRLNCMSPTYRRNAKVLKVSAVFSDLILWRDVTEEFLNEGEVITG